MGSRLQFWINHLRRIDAEGISIASYARREQLSVHSLYSSPPAKKVTVSKKNPQRANRRLPHQLRSLLWRLSCPSQGKSPPDKMQPIQHALLKWAVSS